MHRAYSSEEQFLQDVGNFASSYLKEHAAEIDATDQLPHDLSGHLATRRLLAFDALSPTSPPLEATARRKLILTALQELAKVSGSVAKLVMDQNFGQIEMIRELLPGDIAQGLLERVKQGTLQVAFLMTEPQGGSSASRLRCLAKRDAHGFTLEGQKDWITGAIERKIFLVVAREGGDNGGFGLFLVDRSREDFDRDSIGFTKPKKHLGLRGLGHYRVIFRNTPVPLRHVMIPPNKKALKTIMSMYAPKRCGQASIAIGLSWAALKEAYFFLRGRHPGRFSGSEFQNAEFTFGELYSSILAAEQLCRHAIENCTMDGSQHLAACSAAKLVATELSVRVTNTAIQLCGAQGTASDLPLERYMRDARMLTIAGGTSEIMKKTVAQRLARLLAAT